MKVTIAAVTGGRAANVQDQAAMVSRVGGMAIPRGPASRDFIVNRVRNSRARPDMHTHCTLRVTDCLPAWIATPKVQLFFPFFFSSTLVRDQCANDSDLPAVASPNGPSFGMPMYLRRRHRHM